MLLIGEVHLPAQILITWLVAQTVILGIAGQPNWDHAHRKHAPTCLWHTSYSRQMHKEWQFPSEEYRQFLTVLPGYQLQDSGHRCNLPLHSPCQRHSQNLYKRYYNKVSRIQILPYTSPICLLYTSDAADEEDSVDL